MTRPTVPDSTARRTGAASGVRARGAGAPERRLSDADVRGLVGRAREGDREAFGVLYAEYRRRIHRLARFSLSEAAAEDAVGETFVRAWAALPRYRDTGAPFVAWLYGIARHVVADARRKSSRLEPRAEPDVEPFETGDASLDRMVLGSALARLPDEQRAIVELKFLGGLSNEEVGRALGKTPGAVNTQQWRALGALRELMGGER